MLIMPLEMHLNLMNVFLLNFILSLFYFHSKLRVLNLNERIKNNQELINEQHHESNIIVTDTLIYLN
jgi:hypothetical protein